MSLMNWLSPNAMHSLGWTLLHFVWQGTGIAALAAVLMALCRRASTRYLVAVGALVLMLASPVVTFFFLPTTLLAASSDVTPADSTQVVEAQPTVAGKTVAIVTSTSKFLRFLPSSLFLSSSDALLWLVEGWLFGVAFFSLRSAGGFLLLERERRKQSTMPTARVLGICETLQRQLGLDRAIRYCVCRWLDAPAVIGWFRPMILLPVTALTGLSEEQLRSVVAHELAHIQRFDAFVNIFQIAVETLLFYHPAVWWLNKRIRVEREHCCDDVAVSLCGDPVEYARALTLMEEWRSAPVLAMAANRGPLSERIFRVLGRKSTDSGTRGIGLSGGLAGLTVALVAGNALLGIAYPKPVVHAMEHASESSLAVVSQTNPAPSSAATVATKPSASRRAAEAQPAVVNGSDHDSYIGAMKAAGLADLTFDQLIALKVQNVTPEYVRGVIEQGAHPNADEFVAMRIQGVSPEYIRDLHGLGFSPDLDQIIALKIQDVDAAYVRGLKDAGVQPDLDQLIALKIQGVTPEYARDIRGLGLTTSADELIAMRIQGVTADYIRALQSKGFKFDAGDLISAKIQGITPEFIERVIKHGFQNLSLDKLIQLKQMKVLDSPGEI
jgi:beta-lactamase regulating signal transducer with metallopeptidase domain